MIGVQLFGFCPSVVSASLIPRLGDKSLRTKNSVWDSSQALKTVITIKVSRIELKAHAVNTLIFMVSVTLNQLAFLSRLPEILFTYRFTIIS